MEAMDAERPVEEAQASLQETESRVLRTVRDTELCGAATLSELDAQGQTMDRIEARQDAIGHDLRVAGRTLSGIESWFGSIRNSFKRRLVPPSSVVALDGPHAHGHAETVVEDRDGFAVLTRVPSKGGSCAAAAGRKESGRRVTRASLPGKGGEAGLAAAGAGQDAFLEEVGGGVERLKAMALQMGQVLQDQNEQVERISERTERQAVKIKDHNRRIGNILH